MGWWDGKKKEKSFGARMLWMLLMLPLLKQADLNRE